MRLKPLILGKGIGHYKYYEKSTCESRLFYFIIVETGLTTTNQPIKIIIYEKRSYKYLVEPLIFYLQSGNLAERQVNEPYHTIRSISALYFQWTILGYDLVTISKDFDLSLSVCSLSALILGSKVQVIFQICKCLIINIWT